MTGLDERLYLWTNGLVGRWPALDLVMAFLVNDYFVLLSLSLVLLAMWFAGKTPERRAHLQTAVLSAAAGIGIANILVKLGNLVFYRDRPFTYLPAKLLFYQPRDSSFPSNPAAIAFAAATGMWLANRKLGGVAFFVAAVFAFSRVYAGVHFPSDVVGGALLGLLCGYLAWWAFRVLRFVPGSAIWLLRKLRLA